MSENGLFLSDEENEKPESTRRSGSPPKVNHFWMSPLARACQVWSTSVSAFVSYPVYRMTERKKIMTENDHITSALLREVIIIILLIIIWYRPSNRQDIFNYQDTERLISPIFKTPSLVRAIPVFYRKWYQ